MINLSALGLPIKSSISQPGINCPLGVGSTESIEGLVSVTTNITPPQDTLTATPIEDLPYI